MHEVTGQRMSCRGIVPVVNGILLLRKDIDTSQRTHHQSTVGGLREGSGEIMGYRGGITGVTISLQQMIILVVGEESQVCSYPYPATPFQHIRHIKPPQLLHHGSDILTDQHTITLCQPIESSVYTYPDGTVLLNVPDTDIRSVSLIMVMTDMRDGTCLIEGIAEDRVTSHLPQRSFRITIYCHRQPVEHLTDVTILIRRDDFSHGTHVYHIRTLVIGNPETVIPVLGDTLA